MKSPKREAVKPPKERRLQMKMDEEFFTAVQLWRASQAPDMPTFSDAIRFLVMTGLDSIRRDK